MLFFCTTYIYAIFFIIFISYVRQLSCSPVDHQELVITYLNNMDHATTLTMAF